MDLLESPKANTAGTTVRTLKIEEDGDYNRGRIKPKSVSEKLFWRCGGDK